MTKYYNRKEFFNKRKKPVSNRVNNGLASCLDIPCMPNGEVYNPTLMNKLFNIKRTKMIKNVLDML